MKKRIKVLNFFIILIFIIIFIKLLFVKTIKHNEYYQKALDLWTRNAPVIGGRGNIYDRNGNLIVGNSLTPTIITIPKQVEDIDKTSLIISNILKVSTDKIKKHLTKNVSVEIIKPEALRISIDQAKDIASHNLKGIYIVGDSSRYYPYQNTLAQVLGITGIDNQGITGIEYIYDDILKDQKGSLNIYTDAHGNALEDLTSYYTNNIKGADLYLTIDLELQLTVERLLDNIIQQYQPEDAIILAMNPKNGEILAVGSRPTFDIENYQKYDQSIYNRNLAIWKSFEPGSTFKILTYAMGLEEKVFSLNEPFYDPGYMIIDGTRIKDWKVGGHGKETFLEVLQNSCNPGFMTIGLRLGKEKFFSYLDKFGIGKKTGIDLLGESSGIIFDVEKVGNVELATSSFGQANSVTAIQLVTAVSSTINGGNLYQPYIVKKAVSGENKLLFEKDKTLIRQVISKETSDTVNYCLESVVALGTGRNAYLEGHRIGGKTGTAQIVENGSYIQGQYITSFIGMAPMDDPQIVVFCAVTKPKNTIQYGSIVAAPIVKEIIAEAFTIFNIPKRTDGIKLNARYYIDKQIYEVDNFIGLNVNQIRSYNYPFLFKIEGTGNQVINQIPEPNEKIIEGGYVILYT